MGKIIEYRDEFRVTETIIPKITEDKELYNLNDEDMEVLPEGSIKYELNLIEFPIFSKDKKVKEYVAKKYIFSEKNDEYLEITPSAKQEHISNKILQEFDEQVFYGLMRIYEERGNKEIASNYSTLAKISGIQYKGANIKRIKDSLERMRGCTITFNKCFFQKEDNFSVKDTKEISLLSSLRVISIKDKVSEVYSEEFEKHKNLKEIFVATLNDEIIKNLDNKIHKYFQIEDLTEIKNTTARKIYIMLTKWRHWQKGKKLRRTSRFLASRIPLSWKKQNIAKTIKILEKACLELKDLNKIKDFKINKNGMLANSTIDFIFGKQSGVLEKINSRVGIEETGHEAIEITKVEKEELNIKVLEEIKKKEIYSKECLELFLILPKKEQLEARKNKIEELLKSYTFNEIKLGIDYAKRNSKENFFAYFVKAVKNGYMEEEIQKKEKVKLIREEDQELAQMKKELEEAKKELLKEKVKSRYEKLTEEELGLYRKKYKMQEKILKKFKVSFEQFVKIEIEENLL